MIWRKLFPPPRAAEIVLAAPSHAPGCAAIHAVSFARGWSVLEFESLFSDQAVIAHAALRSGSIEGFSLCRIAADEAELLSIAVAASTRRNGIARRLMQAQLDALRREPLRALFLEVDEGNGAARALYGRFGFQEAGRRKGYYAGKGSAPADALILRLPL